jgi:hypothetical protein
VAFGPWVVLPLPILPVWWDRGGSTIEDVALRQPDVSDSVVTVLLEIRAVGAGGVGDLVVDPGHMSLVRSGIAPLHILRSQVVGHDAHGRMVRFRVLFPGRIPVEESFAVAPPEVHVGQRAVEFPAVRYSAGKGWAIQMLNLF